MLFLECCASCFMYSRAGFAFATWSNYGILNDYFFLVHYACWYFDIWKCIQLGEKVNYIRTCLLNTRLNRIKLMHSFLTNSIRATTTFFQCPSVANLFQLCNCSLKMGNMNFIDKGAAIRNLNSIGIYKNGPNVISVSVI